MSVFLKSVDIPCADKFCPLQFQMTVALRKNLGFERQEEDVFLEIRAVFTERNILRHFGAMFWAIYILVNSKYQYTVLQHTTSAWLQYFTIALLHPRQRCMNSWMTGAEQIGKRLHFQNSTQCAVFKSC